MNPFSVSSKIDRSSAPTSKEKGGGGGKMPRRDGIKMCKTDHVGTTAISSADFPLLNLDVLMSMVNCARGGEGEGGQGSGSPQDLDSLQ